MKTAHPVPSSSSEFSSPSGPPSYAVSPVYSGFYELRESKDLYLRAAKTSKLAQEAMLCLSPTMKDAEYTALSTSPKTLESPSSSFSHPPDYAIDSASSLHERSDSKSLYFQTKETSRLAQNASLSPRTGLDNMMERKSDGVPVDFFTKNRGIQNGQDSPAERAVPEPQPLELSRPAPSRRSTGPKRNRLQEWYEQEIGRLMGRCENAEKLAEKAQSEEERHCLLASQYQDAAINAMDDAYNLRGIVHSQRDKIVELNNRLEGRFNLIVNNPDELANANNSDGGAVDYRAEGFHRWTPDPPSYEQASDYELFHRGYPEEKGDII